MANVSDLKQVPLLPVVPVFTAEALGGGTSKALLRCPPCVVYLSLKDAETAAAVLNLAPEMAAIIQELADTPDRRRHAVQVGTDQLARMDALLARLPGNKEGE